MITERLVTTVMGPVRPSVRLAMEPARLMIKRKENAYLKNKGSTVMKKYKYKATNHIAETFRQNGLRFLVTDNNDSEQLLAGFSVEDGPFAVARFISRDDDNDVSVRIYALISDIPKEKRLCAMEACNILNRKVRYLKFYIDANGNINAEYDLLQKSPDESVGLQALEIFVRSITILNDWYSLFTVALSPDGDDVKTFDFNDNDVGSFDSDDDIEDYDFDFDDSEVNIDAVEFPDE